MELTYLIILQCNNKLRKTNQFRIQDKSMFEQYHIFEVLKYLSSTNAKTIFAKKGTNMNFMDVE